MNKKEIRKWIVFGLRKVWKSPIEKPSEKTIFPEEHATSMGLITNES